MRIIVTGAAGFIGSAVVRRLARETPDRIVCLDKLTYAAPPDAPARLASTPNTVLDVVDICDAEAVSACFARHEPDAVVHLAAESHVDRSIDAPAAFLQTNIMGTYVLLEATRRHLERAPAARRERFRFLHVSTDEVFGSLGSDGFFREDTAYAPNSPYSASKASSDHLVRAWQETYGVPTLLSNCSNNYGPFQFPEKLIPLMIINALEGRPLPVYGDGMNVRDWLHVDDHADALVRILLKAAPGERFAVGGRAERTNIAVVREICSLVEARHPDGGPRLPLITHVTDRPGHDRRYAIDAGHIEQRLGWSPQFSFEEGLAATVDWYLSNMAWWRPLQAQYGMRRLGLETAAKG